MNPRDFQARWNNSIPEHPISIEQIELWLALHAADVVLKGFHATFVKWNRDKQKMDDNYLIRYASKTMNNEKTRRIISEQYMQKGRISTPAPQEAER
jgi:hypothetical protein